MMPIPQTSKDILCELEDIYLPLNDMREVERFFVKILKRMVEIEEMIANKDNK